MDFKAFFFGLPVAEREAFAQRAHTSRGLLNQVAYRNKQIELGFADVLVTLAGGAVTLDDLPLTENAQRQRLIRDGRSPAIEQAA
jgi:hypothetical protein